MKKIVRFSVAAGTFAGTILMAAIPATSASAEIYCTTHKLVTTCMICSPYGCTPLGSSTQA